MVAVLKFNAPFPVVAEYGLLLHISFLCSFLTDFNVQARDSGFEGDRPRKLWGRQFWQVERHRCCRQGLHRDDDD